MRSKTAIWFECKVRYEKTMEDGMPRKVTETYVVDAVSFGEAETKVIEKMSSYVDGELDVVAVKIAPYKEVFFADSDLADAWYCVKVNFITIDEKTDKEKKTAVTYLINAGNIDSAKKNVDEIMSGTMIDYKTTNISETRILDVFES